MLEEAGGEESPGEARRSLYCTVQKIIRLKPRSLCMILRSAPRLASQRTVARGGGDETGYLCSGVCAASEQVVEFTTRPRALTTFALFGKTFRSANPPLPGLMRLQENVPDWHGLTRVGADAEPQNVGCWQPYPVDIQNHCQGM